MTAELRPARLGGGDLVRLGSTGLRTRPLRAFLAALGIGIGVAAMISVVGISVSSGAQIDRQLDRLGTNLLQVRPGKTLQQEQTVLPREAAAMIGRIGPVTDVAQVATLDGAIYRNDLVPSGETGSMSLQAVSPTLLSTLNARLARGRWFDAATQRYPAVVLGASAAQQLDAHVGTLVWAGGRWCAVVGVLARVELAPALDASALIGWQAAVGYFGFSGHPDTVYVRTWQDQLDAVSAVLPRTASPTDAGTVLVDRPSDAIAARKAASSAISGLLVGLGGVALVVGGVGIANTMIISVLERRPEIGLRRSLGATRGQIRGQFVTEALLLSLLGGVGGTVLGTAITISYAHMKGWPGEVPLWATGAGLGATLAIGMVAGLYPAIRASRLSPTAALSVS